MLPTVMHRHLPLKPAALFLLAYLLLLALSLRFGSDYVGFLLPLYRWEITHLTQDFTIQSLLLGENRGEQVVALSLLTRYFVAGNQVIPPDVSVSCSTLLGHALQHPLLMLSLVIAWPASTLKQRLGYVACALPFLLLVELLDTPLVLLGSAQDVIIANVAPGTGSLTVDWMNFMNGGGRLALSLAGGVAAISCAQGLVRLKKKRLLKRGSRNGT